MKLKPKAKWFTSDLESKTLGDVTSDFSEHDGPQWYCGACRHRAGRHCHHPLMPGEEPYELSISRSLGVEPAIYHRPVSCPTRTATTIKEVAVEVKEATKLIDKVKCPQCETAPGSWVWLSDGSLQCGVCSKRYTPSQLIPNKKLPTFGRHRRFPGIR